MSTYKNYSRSKNAALAPQTAKAKPNQVLNNAGGYVFKIEPLKQLERFLILGVDGPTYYVAESKLTADNDKVVVALLDSKNWREAVDLIEDVSVNGRGMKNDPCVFALAIAASHTNEEVRSYALTKLNAVCRIGTHLFQFVEHVNNMRGWGNQLKRAVANWYLSKDYDKLGYQLAKYQQRDGWSHKDVLRLCHPKTTGELYSNLFAHVVGKPFEDVLLPGHLFGMELIKSLSVNSPDFFRHVNTYELTREMVPTESLANPKLWEIFLNNDMPLTAMIRNLGNMTRIGTLKNDLDKNTALVVEALGNQEKIAKAKLHPITILLALRQYESGRGLKGSGEWKPIASIVRALDDAFYLSFKQAEPTGKSIYLGLDISGSMSSHVPGTNISSSEAGAAMAMYWAQTEKKFASYGFSSVGVGGTAMKDLKLRSAKSLKEATKMTQGPFGSTDCGLPMRHALKEKMNVDLFVVITDNETYAGPEHPFVSLKKYRSAMNKNAKLVVMATTPTPFSIADPSDSGMLDIVGFDSSAPVVIRNFSLSS